MKIAAITKLKNGILFRAAKELGGQSALARALDESVATVGDWCNMKSMPPASPNKWWSEERLAVLERKLFDVTGKTLDEIFPDDLRRSKILKQKKERVVYADVTAAQLTDAMTETLLVEDQASKLAEDVELHDAIEKALQSLSYREREIVILRFGLGGERPLLLREVAERFNVTKERVRCIEARALKNLRDLKISADLVGFCD